MDEESVANILMYFDLLSVAIVARAGFFLLILVYAKSFSISGEKKRKSSRLPRQLTMTPAAA